MNKSTPDDKNLTRTIMEVSHEFNACIQACKARGHDPSKVLMIVLNATLRLLVSSGVKPRDVKRMVGDNLGVIRREM